jgi:alkyl hydroperoxide reductase subunit F
MYDLIIIGGGPAGVSAGVYAARKMLKTLLITESFGGQSTDSMGIQNWIGTIEISGADLGKSFEAHLRAYADGIVDIKTGERVTALKQLGKDHFSVSTPSATYESKTVLITSGSSRRKLEVPGAKEFENKGVTYCASCDGPVFSGQDVAVIGGGNAGFETAAQLLAYCKSVTLFNRTEHFKADEMTVAKVLANPKMKAITNVIPKEVKGEKFVKSLVYENVNTHEVNEINVSGIFVEIGLLPATDFISGVVPLNQFNQIMIDHKDQRTQVEGVWAAGDATDSLYHQNNIASGDAVKALEDIYLYIHA